MYSRMRRESWITSSPLINTGTRSCPVNSTISGRLARDIGIRRTSKSTPYRFNLRATFPQGQIRSVGAPHLNRTTAERRDSGSGSSIIEEIVTTTARDRVWSDTTDR